MNNLFGAIILLCLASAAHAEETAPFTHPGSATQLAQMLASTARELGQAQVLRGAFTQRKTLREIPKPLTSTGDFVFARDQGIYWHTRTPFDSEFILTRAGMVQNDGGAQALRVSSEQQPGLKVAAQIFFALFALDLDTLSSNFDLFGDSAPQHWQVGLRPKNAAMAAAFKQAVISGGARVEQVLLQDGNGDRTEISLHDLQSAQTPLSADERKRFGLQ